MGMGLSASIYGIYDYSDYLITQIIGIFGIMSI